MKWLKRLWCWVVGHDPVTTFSTTCPVLSDYTPIHRQLPGCDNAGLLKDLEDLHAVVANIKHSCLRCRLPLPNPQTKETK